MNEKNLLASLVVFRELYDKGNDIYGIIGSFINDIICEKSLHTFSLSELTQMFNEHYEFNIPSSVLKTALKRLDYIQRGNGLYKLTDPTILSNNLLEEKGTIKSSHDLIFENLLDYTNKKRGSNLTGKEQYILQKNFCNYLLDESNGEEYLEYISSFIIDNQTDTFFNKNINLIREGVILYSGIKYNNDSYNFNQFGSWRNKLNIFLDTEIIFHILGFNGELYQKIAQDFLDFVTEINRKSKEKLIHLFYFEEVKNEIESFFTKARYILQGEDSLNPQITAMASILNGCKSKSDILGKKSDLNTNLYRLGIKEFTDEIRITERENFKFNLLSQEVIEELNEILGIQNSEALLSTLNKVSLLRKDDTEGNFENAGYILLSGNSKTLKAAFNSSVFERFRIPLATNLNFIINRFWYKLNKGFSNKEFPTSFNIITKSQIVLSKVLNESIGQKYDNLRSEYKAGKITRETASNRINDLRLKARKPEEIKEELVDDVLNFITLDSIDDYIEKQNHFKEKASKLEKVTKELKERTEESTEYKEQLIKEKNKQIKEKREIINNYDEMTAVSSRLAEKKIKRQKRILTCLIISFFILLVVAIFYFGWDAMEKYTYILGIPLVIVTLINTLLNKPLHINKFWEDRQASIKNNKIEKLSKYTQEQIQRFNDEVKELENEIHKIRY